MVSNITLLLCITLLLYFVSTRDINFYRLILGITHTNSIWVKMLWMFLCKLIIWYWFLLNELIHFLPVFPNNNTALFCMKVVEMKSGVPMDFLPPSAYWASHPVLRKARSMNRAAEDWAAPLPPTRRRKHPDMRCAFSWSEPEFQGFSTS